MEIKDILSKCDHTLLAVTAGERDILTVCDDGLRFGVASVCIPPCFVRTASEYLGGRLPVCTVIGFPNGYNTTAAKCRETAIAVAEGASEIDTVANVGMIKSGDYGKALSEVKAIRRECEGKILKVIIETCLLEDAEKIEMCRVVAEAGADYIKTSTGFSKYGATDHDVELLAKHAPDGLLVKAAGGISSFEDAERFINLGASRLGTSRLVKILKEKQAVQGSL
ncbi:MAG: deoxyribose-phosphate aldolase [Clostridia bacterium]|nr:deoxyribose-phosphate aldolase [Clostridia bacterium]